MLATLVNRTIKDQFGPSFLGVLLYQNGILPIRLYCFLFEIYHLYPFLEQTVPIPTVFFCPMPPALSSDISAHLLSSRPWKQFPAAAVFTSPVSCIMNHTVQCTLVSSAGHSQSCLPQLSGPTWRHVRCCTDTCNDPQQQSGYQRRADHSQRLSRSQP